MLVTSARVALCLRSVTHTLVTVVLCQFVDIDNELLLKEMEFKLTLLHNEMMLM